MRCDISTTSNTTLFPSTCNQIGVCKSPPGNKTNALGPNGNGTLEGDVRTFDCNGNYKWSDRTLGEKAVTCLASGEWSLILESCTSMHITNAGMWITYHPNNLPPQ